MAFATFTYTGSKPLFATAVHNGHELRPSVAARMALDERTRLREEDSHTDYFAHRFDNHAVVHTSRFEVDVNRPRSEAVYQTPSDAWGLDLWKETLDAETVAASLQSYDNFYEDLRVHLDKLVGRYGGFVLYDIHSYNHRRSGPTGEPDPPGENPTINLGTGSLPQRWSKVAQTFVDVMSSHKALGEPLDVRSNIKFKGRQVSAWTHENYGGVGCALSIEFKKIFMDEWTDDVDWETQSVLADALMATTGPVLEMWQECL